MQDWAEQHQENLLHGDQDHDPELGNWTCEVVYITFDMYKIHSRHQDDPDWTFEIHLQHLDERGWVTGSLKENHRMEMSIHLHELRRRFELGDGEFLFDTKEYFRRRNQWMWADLEPEEGDEESRLDAGWLNPDPIEILDL